MSKCLLAYKLSRYNLVLFAYFFPCDLLLLRMEINRLLLHVTSESWISLFTFSPTFTTWMEESQLNRSGDSITRSMPHNTYNKTNLRDWDKE